MAAPDYRAVAVRAARAAGINPAIFLRQINQESGFNPAAVSPKGAVGIAQIVPKYHPDVNARDPVASLDWAARADAQALRASGGSWADALSRYNSGQPWSVGRGIQETRNYVNTILGAAAAGAGGTAAVGGPPALGGGGVNLTAYGNALTRLIQDAWAGRQANVEEMLAPVFRGVDFTPPGGAGPPLGPAGPAAAGGFYVHPLGAGFTRGRTDMGVDYTGAGPLHAIGAARVTRVSGPDSGTGWPGAGGPGTGSMIVYQLTDGPQRGKYVYTAENIVPARGLVPGMRLARGQVFGTARGFGPMLEMGWAADPNGTTLAHATTGYTEGQVTPAGQSFGSFIQDLPAPTGGAPSGA